MADRRTTHVLTTVDNPWNPITQFKEWYSFDSTAGYHSLALLARVIVTSSEMSEADQILAREDAIDTIVRLNASGVHRKVSAETGLVIEDVPS
jgi:hypothetical protein